MNTSHHSAHFGRAMQAGGVDKVFGRAIQNCSRKPDDGLTHINKGTRTTTPQMSNTQIPPARRRLPLRAKANHHPTHSLFSSRTTRIRIEIQRTIRIENNFHGVSGGPQSGASSLCRPILIIPATQRARLSAWIEMRYTGAGGDPWTDISGGL